MAAFGLLAAGIAHEVGNPLAALSSLVQMLQRRGPGSVHLREARPGRPPVAADRAHHPRAGRFLEAGVHRGDPGADRRGRRRGPRHRQVLSADQAAVDHDGWSRPICRTIPIVRDYLTQVVLNLVLNAIDATEDQGRIHVEAHVEDGWLVLSVDDDGRGISLADRCRLFQPFFTTKPHGTGLGLFVSRQILEDVSGRLSYRSELGRGSTFIVRLPLDPSVPSGPLARDDAPPVLLSEKTLVDAAPVGVGEDY